MHYVGSRKMVLMNLFEKQKERHRPREQTYRIPKVAWWGWAELGD